MKSTDTLIDESGKKFRLIASQKGLYLLQEISIKRNGQSISIIETKIGKPFILSSLDGLKPFELLIG